MYRQLIVVAGVMCALTRPSEASMRTVVPTSAQITIACGVGFTCPIVFADSGENVVSVNGHGGCPADKPADPTCLFSVDHSAKDAAQEAVMITPLFDRLRSNFIVGTNRRYYNIEVVSSKTERSNTLSFDSGNKGGGRGDALGSLQNQVLDAAAAIHPEPEFETWDPDYHIEGLADFKPLWVATDGRRTFMAMPNFMQASPSVFIIRDGIRPSVDAIKRGRIWIFDGVPTTFELELGEGRTRRVVHVRRGR